MTGTQPVVTDENLRLRAERIVMTAELLAERIEARVPGRNLTSVARSLRDVAGKAVWEAAQIQKPIIWLRAISRRV